MNLFVLVGVVIIIIGFTLKLDAFAVVIISAIVTGLTAGLSIYDIFDTMGKAFVANRLMSIFLLSLPVIAILENHGLKERSAYLIGKLKNVTAGKIMILYTIIRAIASALSIRIGGHVQFVRPLVLPMSEAAAKKSKGESLTNNELEKIKGLNAAIENYANFFAQNLFVGAAGLLLVQGTLKENGFDVSLETMALYSIPICVSMLVISIIQISLFDKKLIDKSKGGKQ